MRPNASVSEIEQTLDHSERLLAEGRWRQSIELLRESVRAAPSPEAAERLVAARHAAAAQLGGLEPPTPWPVPTTDLFGPTEGIPTIASADLSAPAIGSALEHHSALHVRGLLDDQTVERVLQTTRRSFDEADAFFEGTPATQTSPWFRQFEASKGSHFSRLDQAAARLGGGVLLAESPISLHEVLEAYERVGLVETIGGYLGERPLLSVEKSTLRRSTADLGISWHQDGAFIGAGARVVNAWTALTPCGTDAPSLDVYAQPLGRIVETGTPGADYSWSVSTDVVASLGAERVTRLQFDPGDALLFNEQTLHRSGISAKMTGERFAIETWFFAPSTYPSDSTPIVV